VTLLYFLPSSCRVTDRLLPDSVAGAGLREKKKKGEGRRRRKKGRGPPSFLSISSPSLNPQEKEPARLGKEEKKGGERKNVVTLSFWYACSLIHLPLSRGPIPPSSASMSKKRGKRKKEGKKKVCSASGSYPCAPLSTIISLQRGGRRPSL